jgi:hypothetical protein
VFQTALGLPSSFASIDLDQQLGVLKSRAEATFGKADIRQFADPEKLQTLVRTYLARAEIGGSTSALSGSSAALQLLQAMSGR